LIDVEKIDTACLVENACLSGSRVADPYLFQLQHFGPASFMESNRFRHIPSLSTLAMGFAIPAKFHNATYAAAFRIYVTMASFYHGRPMKHTDIWNAIAVLVFKLPRSRSQELKAALTPQPHYDYHGKTAEELMRECDFQLIKPGEFLRELGELP